MTLVEILLFLAILSVVLSVALPLLFEANENRLLQQTIATVEQNGAQLLDNLALRVRQSQRIISPTQSDSGSVLALETGSGMADPIIVGVATGALQVIRHATRQVVSSQQVAVKNFLVRNTSVSSLRQSVYVRFTLSRIIRLQQPRTYTKTFETVLTLPPNDRPISSPCVCDIPACSGSNYTWSVCENGDCYAASTQMTCP